MKDPPAKENTIRVNFCKLDFPYFISVDIAASGLENHFIGNLSDLLNLDFYQISILQPFRRLMESRNTTSTVNALLTPAEFCETYLGVPVMITVPFLKVIPRLRCRIIWPIPKIKSSVEPSCLSSPLAQVRRRSFSGSPTAFRDAMTGPIGANLSKDFAGPCWDPDL